MELNTAQELVRVDKEPILLVLLDTQKAYYNLDRGRIMHTLEGYRSRPKMRVIME